MSERTKLFIFRIALCLFWTVLNVSQLVDAAHDGSVAFIISWSIVIGLYLGLIINLICDQIVYLIKKRRMKNVVSELTEQETEELPF